MATRGRKPTPTRLKELKGNPGKRALNGGEPVPPVGKPTCPRHIAGEGRKEWARITRLLDEMRLLSKAEGPALALYCQMYERWVEAEGNVKKFGMIIPVGENGALQLSPYVSIANQAMAQMQRLLCEFGLTPSSRSRIKLPPAKKESKFESFMQQKQQKGK